MPKYAFTLTTTESGIESYTVELTDKDAAISEALKSIGQIIAELTPCKDGETVSLEVTGTGSRLVARATFALDFED
ncbi:MAG: hypothetical protein GC201_04380 [Alphaproteobacteria bacterium]|nr:hypothetical protein [Alphaproteobacteria bacterium]